MTPPPVDILAEGTLLRTRGLAARGHPELEVRLDGRERQEAAGRLLQSLAQHLVEERTTYEPGQTIQHGCWLLEVQEGAGGRRRLGALRDDAGDFHEAVDQALVIDEAQRHQCALLGADFAPPAPDQLVVVDAAALQAGPVEGTRYPGPAHMSGWWITSVQGVGGTDDLEAVHVPHVITRRPDLLQLLALPVGWRFATADGIAAWYDERVAADEDEDEDGTR